LYINHNLFLELFLDLSVVSLGFCLLTDLDFFFIFIYDFYLDIFDFFLLLEVSLSFYFYIPTLRADKTLLSRGVLEASVVGSFILFVVVVVVLVVGNGGDNNFLGVFLLVLDNFLESVALGDLGISMVGTVFFFFIKFLDFIISCYSSSSL
jgi:hypothetical protein